MYLWSLQHRDSFVLFKAGLNSLNGQCIYIKITNSAVSEGYHSSTAQADKNKNMTVQVLVILGCPKVIFCH